MNSEIRLKRQKRKDMFLAVFVIVIMLFGIFKIVELIGGYLGEDEPVFTRQVSIVESVEVASKESSATKKVAMIEYYSGYFKGFREIDLPLNYKEQEFLYLLSKDYDISYPLLLGLIDLESSFNKDLVSNTNDYGLMQINAVNHDWLKHNLEFDDILDPYNNIRSGTFILSQLFDKYGGDENKVLMAYNMGEGGAKSLWNKGVMSSAYSERVLEKKEMYEKLLK